MNYFIFKIIYILLFTRCFPSISIYFYFYNFPSTEWILLNIIYYNTYFKAANYLKFVPKSFIFIVQFIRFFFCINSTIKGTYSLHFLRWYSPECVCISTTRYMSNASLYIDRRHCNPYNIITVCVRRGWHTAAETGDGPDGDTAQSFPGLEAELYQFGTVIVTRFICLTSFIDVPI